MTQLPEQAKQVVDALSVFTSIASFVTTWVPPLAVAVSFVWVCVRLYSGILDVQIKRKELNDDKRVN